MAETTEIRHPLEKIPLGGMVEAALGDAKVLLVRDAAGVRAFQAKCPHLGAPLAKGEICGGRLYCPWHKAAFALADGGLEEPPALAALTRYPVRIEGDEAVATLEPLAHLSPAPRQPETRVLVVGTGAAAVACATSLRRLGFAGAITMVGREAHAPYDRTKLSKQFLAKSTPAEKTLLEPDFYAAHRIEPVQATVARIEPEARRVVLEDGRLLDADALVIATGSRAVVPDVPGVDLDGVHTLRSLDDAVRLSAAAEDAKQVVVIGSGFIGLEAAAFLTKRGLAVTVLAREAVPFAKRFGEAVGAALKRYHAGNGVHFAEGRVARIAGAVRVEAVETEAGERLPADIVLIGAGAAPETGAIAGVEPREDGGVTVGSDLRLAPNVWLAGDIAAFPEWASGETARIEHWRLAQQHGSHIAHQIVNEPGPFAGAPFFWSNQGDKRLDYCGYAPGFDRIILRGSTDDLDFIAYYVRGERVTAACSVNRNPEFTAFLHLLGEGRAPSCAEIDAGVDPRTRV